MVQTQNRNNEINRALKDGRAVDALIPPTFTGAAVDLQHYALPDVKKARGGLAPPDLAAAGARGEASASPRIPQMWAAFQHNGPSHLEICGSQIRWRPAGVGWPKPGG